MRACKIIATAFTPRAIREETTLNSRPIGYFSHSQNFPTPESVISLLKYSLADQERYDPGIPMDTVIINNNVGFECGNNYLDQIHNTSTRSGKIICIHRDNFGRAYGAYNDAFKLLGSNYDYFLFTEDDVLICGDGYISAGIDVLNRGVNIGFAAYLGLNLDGFNSERNAVAMHAHGAIGLSSKEVLQKIYSIQDCLPHPAANQDQSYKNIVLNGEIEFTNIMVRNGFQLAEIDANIKMYDFAYDKIRGIKMPRYFPAEQYSHTLNQLLSHNTKGFTEGEK